MIRLVLITLLVLLFITSCNFRAEKDNRDSANLIWSTITIVSDENTTITIDSYFDTAKVYVYHVGSFFSPRPKRTENVRVDTINAMFTKSERDSIFYLTTDLINHPTQKNGGCTDFVGDLKLIVDYGTFEHRQPGSSEQTIEYTGVCNWTTLSANSMQLHRILKRKLKNVFLGEHDEMP